MNNRFKRLSAKGYQKGFEIPYKESTTFQAPFGEGLLERQWRTSQTPLLFQAPFGEGLLESQPDVLNVTIEVSSAFRRRVIRKEIESQND